MSHLSYQFVQKCALFGLSPQYTKMFTPILGSEGAARLAFALPQLSELRALQLSGNGFGAAGARAFSEALAHKGHSLDELDLALNGLGSVGLEFLLSASLKLRSLGLRGNWLASDGVEVLLELLSSCPESIEHLDLAQNRFGPQGVRRLLEGLPSLPRLRTLDLAENHFATAAFAGGNFNRLASLTPNLEELNLSACSIGSDDEVLRAVGAGLPTSLKSLSISASQLQAPQIVQLLEAMPRLAHLQHLGLVQARLDDAAIQAIVALCPLDSLPHLQCLDISGNSVSDNAIESLVKGLRLSPTFRQLRTGRPRRA